MLTGGGVKVMKYKDNLKICIFYRSILYAFAMFWPEMTHICRIFGAKEKLLRACIVSEYKRINWVAKQM